ncbi:TadE/TadG family type IV pilus assembly protein [Thioclava sp.]|uniref:TadE/TadG family type IV pilus assembly protein n=1 Tax=Thioclava sp. TaxID=1933450 RepID=UPI003242EFFB
MRWFRAYRLRSPRRIWRDDEGAQLVEFALVLPLMLILFAAIIESGRMFLAYQTVIGGVRDASRYLARITPRSICETGGSVDGQAETLAGIVGNAITGGSVLGGGVTVTTVEPSLDCIEGSYRFGDAPIVEVAANVTITFPFAGLFTLITPTTLGTVTTTIADQNRVFGS